MSEKHLYSINELMTLTGKSFRTLKKLLEGVEPESDNGNGGIIYDLKAALANIYGNVPAPSRSLTDYKILREKSEARLAEAKSLKLRLELDLMRKRLILTESAEKEWASLVSAFRSRMLALPTRAALIISDLETVQEIEIALKEFIHEALSELSKDASIAQKEPSNDTVAFSASSEAEAD